MIGRVFIQYENLFGQRLKSIVNKPETAGELMRKVYRLLDEMLSGIDYDIFRPGNWENWDHSLSTFNRHLEHLESEAKSIIDISLTMLRSSELGLQLIRDINTIDTRDVFVEFISMKHENLLRFFVSEINAVEHEFIVSHCRGYYNSVYHLLFLALSDIWLSLSDLFDNEA